MEMAAQKISLSSSILLQCKLRDGIELENCPQTEDEFIKREVRLRIKLIEPESYNLNKTSYDRRSI